MGRSESRIAHIMKEYRSKIGEPDGKVVFENNELVGIDERKLAREADRAHEKALRNPCPAFQKAKD